MMKLVIMDCATKELLVLNVDEYDPAGKLVVAGEEQTYVRTRWIKHKRVPGGSVSRARVH